MAILNKSLGLRYTVVDFNNIGAMNHAVLRGDAQLVLNTPSSLRAHIDSGAVVPLAAVSTARYADLPSVPTLKEATGYMGYLPLLWAGVFVPEGVPAAAFERIDMADRVEADRLGRTLLTCGFR